MVNGAIDINYLGFK